MKKYRYTIIGIIVAMVLVTLSGYGQTDSTSVNPNLVNVYDNGTNLILKDLFPLICQYFGVSTPVGSVIGLVLTWLAHYIRVRYIKKKAASGVNSDLEVLKATHEVEKENLKNSIISDLKDGAKSAGGNIEHASLFKRLIDRIENKN